MDQGMQVSYRSQSGFVTLTKSVRFGKVRFLRSVGGRAVELSEEEFLRELAERCQRSTRFYRNKEEADKAYSELQGSKAGRAYLAVHPKPSGNLYTVGLVYEFDALSEADVDKAVAEYLK